MSEIIGVSKRFKTYMDQHKKLKETILIKALNKFNEIEDLPDMYYIFGERGNGKSFACQYLLYRLCYHREYCKGKFITLSDLVMELYACDFKERVKVVNNYKDKYNLLIIDEIDKVKLTDWKEEMIFNIVDGRMNNMRKTVYTSNMSPDDLTEILGINIMSRILSDGKVLENKSEVLR